MKKKQFIPVMLALAMSVMLWAQDAPKLELRISESKVNLTREEESGELRSATNPVIAFFT
ncbi:MAG: hypothetical protein U5N26_11430 [Candidatus Marinimicrobia bacterium]|nr:hypothetical protein [Candidatus Neomarinimicrobiota bacterium]